MYRNDIIKGLLEYVAVATIGLVIFVAMFWPVLVALLGIVVIYSVV